MEEATFRNLSVEEKMSEHFLLWAKQQLELKKLDQLKTEAKIIQEQIEYKNKKKPTISSRIQTIISIENVMETLDKLDASRKSIDVDCLKILTARLNDTLESGRASVWDILANMAPAEDQEEISEQLKQIKVLTDELPDPKIVSDRINEISMELKQLQEMKDRFNNLSKETAETKRKVKNILLCWHLLNKRQKDLSNTVPEEENE